MNIIPKDWLQECEMKRIILHWTGGSYHPSSLDKEHYHILIDGEGKLHKGKYDIKDNENIIDDSYAKHIYLLNTKSIGVAVCCMHGAREKPFNAGKFPITEAQFNSLAKVCAELLAFYKLPLFEETCLSHAEVERVYGVEQKGKWDIRVVPIKNLRSSNFNMLHSAKEAGDIIREAVEEELTKQIKQENLPHELTTALPAAEIILPGGDSIYIPAGWSWEPMK